MCSLCKAQKYIIHNFNLTRWLKTQWREYSTRNMWCDAMWCDVCLRASRRCSTFTVFEALIVCVCGTLWCSISKLWPPAMATSVCYKWPVHISLPHSYSLHSIFQITNAISFRIASFCGLSFILRPALYLFGVMHTSEHHFFFHLAEENMRTKIYRP